MKQRKLLAVSLTVVMAMSLAACKGDSEGSDRTDSKDQANGTEEGSQDKEDQRQEDGLVPYTDLKLGEDFTDLKASISVLSNRVDMDSPDYEGTIWSEYIEEFNQDYPDIQVEVETVKDYAKTALDRLQSGEWGDVMMIPAVAKSDLENYFLPYGSLAELDTQVRFTGQWAYGGQAYGIPSNGNAQGIVYNKKVFQEAGIYDEADKNAKLPSTPEEFLIALQKIKDYDSTIIPLYTNYAAEWTMGAWDAYIGGCATGDSSYYNEKLLHTANPFADPGNDTGAYHVYKILYDAVAQGLTEEDYKETDWEESKSMMNQGQIGCMVLGSWAVSQIQDAGPNVGDIGYMPFPITVNGKQYASAGPDYSYAVNKDSENKQAALIFVKWMTEKSGYSYKEGGVPIALEDENWPDVYSLFLSLGIEFVPDAPAVEGEEDLLNLLNTESGLNLNHSGDTKIQQIIDHAAQKDQEFDEIMKEWNQKWTKAQEAGNVEIIDY